MPSGTGNLMILKKSSSLGASCPRAGLAIPARVAAATSRDQAPRRNMLFFLFLFSILFMSQHY
jgi:hypothetical protein